jgi:NTE family protein
VAAVLQRRCDLALAGPGFVGAVHVAAAVAELLDAGYAPQRVAGVSGGAIVAALVAAGYDGPNLRELLTTSDVDRLAGDPVQIGRWLDDLLARREVRSFRQLLVDDPESSAGAPWRLVVAVGDASSGALVRLPADMPTFGRDPESLGVAEAVVSALGYAAPAESSSADLGGLEAVDGFGAAPGLISVFDRTDGRPARWPTFGVRLTSRPSAVTPDVPVRTSAGEALELLRTATGQWNRYLLEDEGVENRTVWVDTTGVSATDFGLSPAQQERLYEQGRAATAAFLARDLRGTA